MSAENELLLRLRTDVANPNVLSIQDAIVKAGPRAWKTAALLTFGDKTTGEIKGRTFIVQTWERRTMGSSYEFQKRAEFRWSCDNDEISVVQALLNESLPRNGRFLVVEENSTAALLERLATGDSASAVSLVSDLLRMPDVREALSKSDAVAVGSSLVVAQRQRAALAVLEAAVNDPDSTEHSLQTALDDQWWLFGGQFIGQHQRRQLTVLDQLDIPLLRADGSIHVVELKRANIPRVVEPYRNHLIVGSEVHQAVGQTMNYLRALDEQSASIQQNLQIDVRRATATVVIGHPQYVAGNQSPQDISQTLRTYNSHLARVQVITYAELIDGAKAALKLLEIQAEPPEELPRDPEGPDPASAWENEPPF